MSQGFRLTGVLALAVLCAAGGGGAGAVTPETRDLGKFFSADAVKKADAQIREIFRKHDLDLLVETFATVPADQAEKFKGLDGTGRNEFFANWAGERIKERVVNGVYLLICHEPRYLYVKIAGHGDKTLTSEFRKDMYEAVRREFAGGRYDEGLQAAVRLMEQRLGKPAKK
jgi:hypothetical protein